MPEPAHKTPRQGLFALFVDRPVFTLMVLLATVVVGVIAYTRLPLRFELSSVTRLTIAQHLYLNLSDDYLDRRILVQHRQLRRESLRRPHVIGVNESHYSSASVQQSSVARSGRPLILLADVAYRVLE